MTDRMTTEELQRLGRDALRAAVRHDGQAVAGAMEPLFSERCGPGECLAWTFGMIAVAMHPMRKGQATLMGGIAQPGLFRVGTDGQPADQVNPEQAPVGIGTYVRLAACWLNDDDDTAIALFKALVDRDDIEGIVECMQYALEAAATRARAYIGGHN